MQGLYIFLQIPYSFFMNLLKTMPSQPWVQFLLRLYQNLQEDFIGLLAAGVAFYFFLAAFPAIAAMISLYGLFSDPAFVTTQIESLAPFMPRESLKILADQAAAIAASSNAALGLGFIVGITLTLYTTAKGAGALIKGLNIAYNVKERRNILYQNYLAFFLTFVMLAYMLFALSMIAFMPALFNILHLPAYITLPLLSLRWPLLLLSGAVGLQILYNYAPCHPKEYKKKMPRITAGALSATLFWIGGSSLFSMFVSNFGKYNETYGSLGAVVVLMLWFWLSALCILLGAEINVSRADKNTSPSP
jgi:membrane protein